jgi:uncharacterized protein YecE (DUF72 family)
MSEGAKDASRLERRRRREERREKQRKANVGRAQKMHDARQQAPVASARRNEQDGAPSGQEFWIGCSGWFYWHWRDRFYPPGLPTNQWFPHYARHFKTVELNAPFYSWPTVGTVKSWIKAVGRKRFIYTVKVCELITHTKRFRGTKELILDFGYIGDLLGRHMGCFLFQLPPSFHYTPARLRNIVEQLDPARRNVLEFRHESWWRAEVYRALAKKGIIFCSCSAPKLPDELIKTAPEIYIRFHGKTGWYRHDYSDDELRLWAKRIRASGARRVWAYFNNDQQAFAIRNARRLLHFLTQPAPTRRGRVGGGSKRSAARLTETRRPRRGATF